MTKNIQAYLLAIALVLLSAACGKEPAGEKQKKAGVETKAEAPSFWKGKPGPNPRFYEMEQKLDTGGEFYLYSDAKDAVGRALGEAKSAVGRAMPAGPERDQAMVAFQALEELGLDKLEGFGMSAARADDLLRTKVFLSMADRQATVFKIAGPEPHAPNTLAYAPADTALFVAPDLDALEAFARIKSVVLKAGGENAAAEWEAAMAKIREMMGTDLEALLRTLGTEHALLLTLDPTQQVSIPGELPAPIPAPGLAALTRARDDSLARAIVSAIRKNGQIEAIEQSAEGVQKWLLQIPPNPLEWNPVLAFDGQFVIWASTPALLDAMLAAKKSEAGLAAQAEFQELTKNLPAQHNGVIFVGQRFGETVRQLADAAAVQDRAAFDPAPLLRHFLPCLDGLAVVRVNQPDGIWVVCNRRHPETGLPLMGLAGPTSLFSSGGGSVAAGGILVGIAVPGFIKARRQAMGKSCNENLARIDGAKEQYALENNMAADDPTVIGPELLVESDGTGYLRRTPACPGGGVYTYGNIATVPTCSLEDADNYLHILP